MRRKQLIGILGLLMLVQTFALAAFAQATITFRANLGSYTGAPAQAYVLVTLLVPQSCVPASSAGIIPIGPKKLVPVTATGLIAATNFIPSTSITCGGVPASVPPTRYRVEIYQASTQTGVADRKLYSAEYAIGPGDFDLSTAVPVPTTPPPAPLYVYATQNSDNQFSGVQDFSAARMIGFPLAAGFIVENPDTSLDGVLALYVARPLTLKSVRCPLLGSGSITIQVEIRSDPNVAGTPLLNAPLVCDSSKPFTNSFTQGVVPAGNYLVLRTPNGTGTPIWLRVYFEY